MENNWYSIITKKTAALTLRSHFLSQCKPLEAIISIILFAPLSHLSTRRTISSSASIDFTQLRKIRLLFQLDMSFDIVLYKWHKINVFVISFSLIIRFISVYLIFCKHIAIMDIKQIVPNFKTTYSIKIFYLLIISNNVTLKVLIYMFYYS